MAIELARTTRHLTSTTRADGVSPLTRITQALMLTLGLAGTFGVVYFTMIAPEGNLTATDAVVAGLVLIGSLGYILASRKLALNDSEIWGAALGFALLRITVSLLEAVSLAETEAMLFLGLDVAIAVLLLNIKPEQEK
jgi:hypothetical protein